MKKWSLVVLIALFCSAAYADSGEKVEMLSAKVALQNNNGFFVLSDQSYWKVIGFSKRWRSLSEWWNGVQLVSEDYECVPNDWHVGAQIKISPKYGNLEASEANASNQNVLKQCTHLFVNTGTGKILFAIALTQPEFLAQLFNESHGEGYTQGYTQGRLKGFENSNEIYNSGYSEGYKSGYSKGYNDGFKGEYNEGR